MKVLITAGGTQEAIDGVRAITNFSSGKTGATIAQYLHQQGHHVIFVHAKQSALPAASVERVSFVSFNDLNHALQNILHETNVDAIIHLAAVSDYSLESLEADGNRFTPGTLDKLSSSHQELILRLRPNFKIIERIKSYCSNAPIVIAFKLTNTNDLQQIKKQVEKIFSSSPIDYLVHNDLHNINEEKHLCTIYNRPLYTVSTTHTKQELASALLQLIGRNI